MVLILSVNREGRLNGGPFIIAIATFAEVAKPQETRGPRRVGGPSDASFRSHSSCQTVRSEHIWTMDDKSLDCFKVVPLKTGAGYYIVYKYDGLERHIRDFETEAEAEGWIVHKSTEWLRTLRRDK